MLNGLDLFSGIGGISLALKPWVKPVAYCEIEQYNQAVLLSRMSDGQIARAPIWDDVRSLPWHELPAIDIIYGGWPCTNHSLSGDGKGFEGEQSKLFFEFIRLVGELRPEFVFMENVPAITTRGGIRVISEFTELGYDCRWTLVSAGEVGAPHLRKRWFLLAHANGPRLEGLEQHKALRPPQPLPANDFVFPDGGDDLYVFPRDNDGLPVPMDRIKALGNAVVPAQAQEAFKRLMGLI